MQQYETHLQKAWDILLSAAAAPDQAQSAQLQYFITEGFSLCLREQWQPGQLPTVALLLRCFSCFHAQGANSTDAGRTAVVLAAILNRQFCQRTLPEALAVSVERRPPHSWWMQLLGLHLQWCGASNLLAPVRRLLLSSAAMIIVLGSDTPMEAAAAALQSDPCLCADADAWLTLLEGLVDALSDARFRLGPIRRIQSRRNVSANVVFLLDLTFDGTPAVLSRMSALLERYMSFLEEGVCSEAPHEELWEALPRSAIWQRALQCLQHDELCGGGGGTLTAAASVRSEPEVQLVCTALRGLSAAGEEITPTTELLLRSALGAALQSRRQCAGAVACLVATAAFESCASSLFAERERYPELFALCSQGAALMASVLSSSGSDAETVLLATEGVAALTQALQPQPVPEPEEDDDPDDFREFTMEVRHSNERKVEAQREFAGFLLMCQEALGQRLAALPSLDDLESICHYGLELLSGEVDDFQIVFEEVSVALFSTYERVCKLLESLPSCAVSSDPAQAALASTLVRTESACAALETIASAAAAATTSAAETSRPLSMWLPQLALLPLLTQRVVAGATPLLCSAEIRCSTEDCEKMRVRLIGLVVVTAESLITPQAGSADIVTVAIVSVVDALHRLLVPQSPSSTFSSVFAAPERARISALLLQCLSALPRADRGPRQRAARATVATHIGCILSDHRELCFPAEALAATVLPAEPRVRAEVLSTCMRPHLADLQYVLEAVAGVPADEADVVFEERVGTRLAEAIRLYRGGDRSLGAGREEACGSVEEVSSLVGAWSEYCPRLVLVAALAARAAFAGEGGAAHLRQLLRAAAQRFFHVTASVEPSDAVLAAARESALTDPRWVERVLGDELCATLSGVADSRRLLSAALREALHLASHRCSHSSSLVFSLVSAVTQCATQRLFAGLPAEAECATEIAVIFEESLRALQHWWTAEESLEDGDSGRLQEDDAGVLLSLVWMSNFVAAAAAAASTNVATLCTSPDAAALLQAMTRCGDDYERRAVLLDTITGRTSV